MADETDEPLDLPPDPPEETCGQTLDGAIDEVIAAVKKLQAADLPQQLAVDTALDLYHATRRNGG